jgi:hypothetical protein
LPKSTAARPPDMVAHFALVQEAKRTIPALHRL